MKMKNQLAVAVVLITGALTAACSPEVGSEEWCADMKDQPKGDWTANEATDYAKHCILG